jgi:peptide deformylase
MVRELVHDPILLARKSVPATEADLPIARDLLDTLIFHREGCVGMAANMIGQFVNIIAFDCEGSYMVMFNPEILRRDKEYETQEGCLSLLGGPRPARRWQSIKVRYQNEKMQTRIKTFTGWTAQIIQHEIDHCNGVLI